MIYTINAVPRWRVETQRSIKTEDYDILLTFDLMIRRYAVRYANCVMVRKQTREANIYMQVCPMEW